MSEDPIGGQLLKILWSLAQTVVIVFVLPYYMVDIPRGLLGAERGVVFWAAYGVVVAFFLYIAGTVMKDRWRARR